MRRPLVPEAFLAGAMAACLGASGGWLPAQSPEAWPSSVRSWGWFHCDTEGREGRFVRVSASVDATAVLRSDGRIFVNGFNAGAAICVPPPAPAGLHYTDVAIGGFGLGLLSDGNVIVWSGAAQWTPPVAPALPPGTRYVRVWAGGEHALALRSDGALVAWADPAALSWGQTTLPTTLTPGTIGKISAGPRYTLALKTDGSVVAWGDNTFGQCVVPPLPAGVVYVDVYAGIRHALAVRSDGGVEAWGQNTFGKCNVPPVPAGLGYLLVSGGSEHSHAFRSDGVFVTWGDQSLGQGVVPTIPAGDSCQQMASGIHHTVALMRSGRVLAWGLNTSLQSYVASLPKVPRPPRYVHADAGRNHNLALTSEGEILGWGRSDYSLVEVPAALQGILWRKLGCGQIHNVALAVDGNLYAWGDNSAGQCNLPPLPPGVLYTETFSVGPGHTAALRTDGVMVTFGHNSAGQCNLPPLPPGLTYVDADCNYQQTLLVRSDGVLVGVGLDSSGELTAPPPPAGLKFVEVAGADFLAAGLLSDGTFLHWGYPALFIPAPLPFGVHYVQMDGGVYFIALRRSDGRIDMLGNFSYVPPLDPDTSYVEVSASDNIVTARVGPTCTYVSFATGCAGSRPATKLVPRDTPRIGSTLEVTFFDLPVDLAVLIFGWQRIAPLDLGFLGLPGCDLHVSPAATVMLSGQNGQAKWSLPIPNKGAFIGTHFYNQALVLDPNAGNGFGSVMSDAAEAVIGHW